MNRKTSLHYILKVTVFVICLVPLYSLHASTPSKTVTHYKVTTRGISIGDVVTTQRMVEENGNTLIHFETRTSVKASFLWMGYKLSSVEKGLLQNGALASYSHKGEENGVAIDIEGKLENEAFRFTVRENGGTRFVSIPKNSYDHTTMECPEARLDFSGKKQVIKRILDVEKLAVVNRNYQLIKNSHYEVSGKEYPCRIVDFSDPNKKARRWIAWDGKTVIMYRQDGKGEKNSYSVQASVVKAGI
jgi:uncharacterized protein (UPF0262 family)